jgi:hypothetical protein
MSIFSHLCKRFGLGGNVEASNTTKVARPERNNEAIPFDPDGRGIADEALVCRDEAKGILDAVGDESLLLRANCQLALARIFKWLKNPDDSMDFKDVVACFQKLAAVSAAISKNDANGNEASNGLTPEVLEEIEGKLKLM